MMSHVLLALAVAALAFASPTHAAQLYHREGTLDLAAAATGPTTPNTWQPTAVADPSATHTITIGMHFRNRDYFEQLFQEMHDPTHKSWLNHLSREEIHAIIAPPKDVTDRLIQWMTAERGVPAEHVEYLIGANAIRVNSTVGSINALFNTTLHEFTHSDGRKTVRQLGASYMADEFLPLIHIVDGLAMMPYKLKRHGFLVELGKRPAARAAGAAAQHRHSASSSLFNVSVPAPLQQSSTLDWIPANSLYGLYGMQDMSGQSYSTTPTTSTQTVQFYTGDSKGNPQANSFSPYDLQQYSSLWSQSANSKALHVWTIRGPNNANSPTDEPSLDVQSITSFNPVAANQFELVANPGQQYAWASSFVSRTNIAQVVSISYGIDESIFETPSLGSSTQDGILLSNYLSATNNLFMSIGARGTTILASSGDDGAQGTGGRKEINSAGRCVYNPSPYYSDTPQGPTVEFPASSPYVTAVGATEVVASSSAFPAQFSSSPMCAGLTNSQLRSIGVSPPSSYSSYRCLDPSKVQSEQAVSIDGSGFNSGGGFSRYFSRANSASWQSSAVSSYLNSGGSTPSSQYFNSGGRAIPDVAIYGGQFPLILNSAINLAAGTSLSSPLFAAIIALLNQQTLTQKGATIGFANPLLYRMAAQSSGTFKDITAGSNYCPAGDTDCDTNTCQGYQAMSGWDPVTGLGVPNVKNMQNALNNYLALVTGTQTGSVTGISAAAGGASVSVWLYAVLVLVASAMAAMAL